MKTTIFETGKTELSYYIRIREHSFNILFILYTLHRKNFKFWALYRWPRYKFGYLSRYLYQSVGNETSWHRLTKLDYDWYFEWMVEDRKLRHEVGFEPTTFGLLVRRSPNWATLVIPFYVPLTRWPGRLGSSVTSSGAMGRSLWCARCDLPQL